MSEWREIPGEYKFKYRINEDGKVQKCLNGKDWKECHIHSGHMATVVLCRKTHDYQRIGVARTVAELFIRPLATDEVVAHKNGCKFDCHLRNLEIVKRSVLASKYGKERRNPVVQLDTNMNPINWFPSVKEAAKACYVDKTTVVNHCTGRVKARFIRMPFTFMHSVDYEEKYLKIEPVGKGHRM